MKNLRPVFEPWREAARAADVAAAMRADAQGLAQLRERRLAALLRFAARNSRLYRRLLGGLQDPASVPLQRLPVMHKPELMRAFDDWVCDPAIRLDDLRRFSEDPDRIAVPYLGRYVVWQSSGSSGEPALFVQDAAAMAVYDALEALRRPRLQPLRRWIDPWYLGERMVFVGATSGHFASTVSIRRLRSLNPSMAVGVDELSFLQPLDRLLARLKALEPTVLATYPSAAVLLAEQQQAGSLRLGLKEIWTGGETLSSSMRSGIGRAFGCPVSNDYGASEFLTLASECSRGGLHLNSDWAILEPVDEDGRAVPDGQAGVTTLLTNLANHVQPLIRYDLGDRVKVCTQSCACGSPLPLIEVEGRSDDTLRLGPPGGRVVSVLPLALTTVLEDDAGLFDFQLVQQGPCELLLRTGLRGEEAERALRRARASVTQFLASQGVADVQLHCRSGEPAQRDRSGKLQRVTSSKGMGQAPSPSGAALAPPPKG